MTDAIISAFSGPAAPFMMVISALLALTCAITLERVWLFFFLWRVDFSQALRASKNEDSTELGALLVKHPAKSLLKASENSSGREQCWDSMGAEAAMIEQTVRQRVSLLSTAGNVATMLGLLGTVYGLILAFSALSDASANQRSTRLGDGIATAMSTTAWGLLVGIPSLSAHAILEGRSEKILAFCEAIASNIASRHK